MKFKSLILAVTISLFFVLVFVGCGSKDSSNNSLSDATSSPSTKDVTPSSSIIKETPSLSETKETANPSINKNDPKVKEALQNYKNVIENKVKLQHMSYDGSADEGKTYPPFLLNELFKNIKDIDHEYANPYFFRFTILDMDGDGIPEVVLEIDALVNTHYEVLHYYEGMVYGYYFRFRAFSDLKTEGTYSASSGADDNSVNKLSFSGGNLRKITLAYSELTIDGNIESYISDKLISEKELFEYFKKQRAKPKATWYDFNEENIKKYLQ